MFSTTEITSHEEASDNVIHQRLLFAYQKASEAVFGKVLELGCGAGRGLDSILAHCAQYTAIDKNDRLLAFLAKKYPQANFKSQRIPPLKDIPDAQFDCVLSFQVIEHIKDDRCFLSEISRVLKPGGKAILTTPNIIHSLTRNPWHVREYTADELQKKCAQHFEGVKIQGVSGNEVVKQYYRRNKDAVKKITRFDVFNLQHRLPRVLLQIPYDFLNRINRKSLMKKNNSLVNDVSVNDYFLTEKAEEGFDLYAVLQK